ncbi:hypothetical protein [Salipiger sp.]|uniref:hypothetical protein n=1 Tax=Salipiger sp. TaxID=2078585 RepID=UPI003A98272E
MDALIDALLDWIADHSAREIADVPHPVVLELSPRELTREFYSGVASLMPEDGVDERVNALFAVTDGPHGTIYILDARGIEGAAEYDDPHDNPLWREILLHELVHHVQHVSGEARGWACRNAGEMEAYVLGGRYLRERRVSDPMGNRMFWARAYSTC